MSYKVETYPATRSIYIIDTDAEKAEQVKLIVPAHSFNNEDEAQEFAQDVCLYLNNL